MSVLFRVPNWAFCPRVFVLESLLGAALLESRVSRWKKFFELDWILEPRLLMLALIGSGCTPELPLVWSNDLRLWALWREPALYCTLPCFLKPSSDCML